MVEAGQLLAAAMIGRRGGQVCYICELVLKLPADGGVSWMIGVPEERAVGRLWYRDASAAGSWEAD